MTPLRPYQHKFKYDIYGAWGSGAKNIVSVLSTGGGKTVVFSDIINEHNGASAMIAHRSELVGQVSLALARNGVRHNIIAAKTTQRACAQDHMAEFGRSYYDPGSRCAVCSIDTLIRADGLTSWAAQVTKWICDEGHHVVNDNKWDRGLRLFTHPECRGLLPTATPRRADRKGLGRHADGIADAMVEGPPMRWLIDQGYLTDYRMVCVESDMQLLESKIGASGDWSTAVLREAARNSHIVGDVVGQYLQWSRGRLDVTFTPDTETAREICDGYMRAGVRAALLTGKTDHGLRRQILRQFQARQIEQLVVVDIVSEGFDMPAMEGGAFARKTASLATYMQQFGRFLRPVYAPGYDLDSQAGRLAAIAAGPKPVALVRDHVGNFLRHGPPDRPRVWSLDRLGKNGGGGDGIPMRVCLAPGCFQPYERFYTHCPYCGAAPPPPEPAERASPAMVDGDMTLLDAAVLAAMRGQVEALDAPADAYAMDLAARHMPAIGVQANYKRRLAHQEAQRQLRETMAAWGGAHHVAGLSDAEIQRRFYLEHGIDVLSAMALGPDEAEALRERIL